MIHPHCILFNILELNSTSQGAFTPVTSSNKNMGLVTLSPLREALLTQVWWLQTHDCISCCEEVTVKTSAIGSLSRLREHC